MPSFHPAHIDGCPEETLPLLSSNLLFAGDTTATYSWPETEIGELFCTSPVPTKQDQTPTTLCPATVGDPSPVVPSGVTWTSASAVCG